VFGGQLYFSAYDGIHGRELWRFDGVSSSMVADVVPGGQYASFNPSGMTVFKDAIYFNANDGSGAGFELWKYDGANFTMVANINPNPPGPGGDDFLADSNPSNFTVHDHRLFFTADDGSHGPELWVYDGHNAPHIVGDIYSGQYGSNQGGLRSVNGVLYLAADSGDGYGQELYRVVPAPVVDEDADGLPDDWEIEHGLNPASNDAAEDKDADGISNAGEFAAGTEPEIPTSVYRVEIDRDLRLTWPSVPGRTYRVEINDGSEWTLFRTVSAAPAPAETTLVSVGDAEVPGGAIFRVIVTTE
jgi:ELWxxDGT repeat protein